MFCNGTNLAQMSQSKFPCSLFFQKQVHGKMSDYKSFIYWERQKATQQIKKKDLMNWSVCTNCNIKSYTGKWYRLESKFRISEC